MTKLYDKNQYMFSPDVLKATENDITEQDRIACGECGTIMQNMGPNMTRRERDEDNIESVTTFSCRAGRHGSAQVYLYSDGTVKKIDDVGDGHKLVRDEKRISEVSDIGFVYEPFKDPTEWKDPE